MIKFQNKRKYLVKHTGRLTMALVQFGLRLKRIIIAIMISLNCLCSYALSENEGISFIEKYYHLLSEYAAAENVNLAQTIERMHVGRGHVYPDVEINLGHVTEVEGVGIKTEYLVSISSRQNLLLKFVPKDISLVNNNNDICTLDYTLSVYSSNEQPGRDVLKYSVKLRIEIQNKDKKIRSILKRTNSTTPQYTLSVNPSELFFDASGGTRTITVNSNTNWSISVNTASWGHLTSNGNTLTLKVDAYSGTTGRTDYFKIKAGDKEEKISIKQSAPSKSIQPSAQIKSITVSKDQELDDGKGIIIHIAFDIQNMKDKDGRVTAYFYDNDGNALTDENGLYKTTNGKVSTGKNIKPRYDNSSYSDFQLMIPYGEFHLSGTSTKTLKFSVSIWDRSVSPSVEIGESSSYTSFSYSPSTEITLLVDNSASNKTKYFSDSGGRETYYIKTNASSYETWGGPSWCRIENKGSSSFTLVCEPNTSSSDRSDYMKVKAGGKEIRIDIKQNGKRSVAKVENCWITDNVTYMRIHCRFSVAGHKNESIRVCAFFYYSNGKRVNAVDNEFRTPDGQATVQGTDNCTYENSLWEDYVLEIPYHALPKGSLTVQIQIHDKNGTYLAESSHVSFRIY